MVWVQPLCADKTFRTCRSFTIDVHTKRDKCLPCGRTVCRYQPIIESLTYRCMRMQVTGAARRATIEKRKKKYSIKKGFRAAQLVFCPWGRVFRAVPPGEAKRESHYHMLSLFARGSLQGLGTLETPRTDDPLPRIRRVPTFAAACVRAWPLPSTGLICPGQNRRRRYPARRSGCLSVGRIVALVSGEKRDSCEPKRTGQPGHPAPSLERSCSEMRPKRAKQTNTDQDATPLLLPHRHTDAIALPRTHRHTHTHTHTHLARSGGKREKKIDRKGGVKLTKRGPRSAIVFAPRSFMQVMISPCRTSLPESASFHELFFMPPDVPRVGR